MHRDLNDMTEDLGEKVDTLRGRASDRLASGVDELRDRAAEAFGDGAHGELRRLRREIHRLASRTDDIADAVADRMDHIDERLEEHTEVLSERLRDRIDALDETSWFTRLTWLAVGAGVGMAAAALLDPQQGARRRSMLRDQAESTARDLQDQARKRAEYSAGQAKGAVMETARHAMPEQARQPDDPTTLRQKIRSEVIGGTQGAEAVVVAVHSQGRVALKGEVDSESLAESLIERTRRVDGVAEVDNELRVRATAG